MTVTNIIADKQGLTLTVTAHYNAPIGAVWQLWEDPRLLEKWWGPPEYPATVTEHDFRSGGAVKYHMTGPEGDVHGGWWNVSLIEPPDRIEFEDGFLDEHGNPSADMPTIRVEVEIVEEGSQVRMTSTSRFTSTEAMEQLIAMGMEEGARAAMSQIDDLLASFISEG